MHIAYLTSRYPAVSHAFVQREVIALRELGAEVDTFTLKRAERSQVLSEADAEAYVTTYAIQPPRVGRVLADHATAFAHAPARYLSTAAAALRPVGQRGALRQLLWFGEAIHLWAELRRRGLRHVHVHFTNAAADVAMLATRFGGSGWSWSLTLHGPAEFHEHLDDRVPMRLASAAFVACASDWSRSQAMALLPTAAWERLELVRGGVDTQQWAPTPHGTGDGTFRVLNVGRLAPVKGHALLVEAAAELASRGIDVRVKIVGDGPSRAEIERKIEETGAPVELTGAVSQDEIRALYEEADVFALASFREGLPFVLIEALATELPVVATRINGIPELVTEVLVSAGRADELADALARLARDPEERARLGASGRAVVARDYELGRQAELMLAAFAAAISDTSSTNGTV